jgi:hypothetical protein
MPLEKKTFKRYGTAQLYCLGCHCTGVPQVRIRYHRFSLGKNYRWGDLYEQDTFHARVRANGIRLLKRAMGLKYKSPKVKNQTLHELLTIGVEVERTSEWVVQCFFPEDRYIGKLPNDPCMFETITEVKRYMAGKKMMQVRIPEDLHLWLKTYAAMNGLTITEVILTYLERLRAQDEGRIQVDEL